MAYGTLKVDFITFDSGGIDQTITVSGISNTLSGFIQVTGVVSGSTIQGTSGLFTNVTGSTIQAITIIGTSTVSGNTVTGQTIQAGTSVVSP